MQLTRNTHNINKLSLLALIMQSSHAHVYYLFYVKEPTQPLIHRAAAYGELDTLTDLIEEKGVDPCTLDKVGSY